MMQLSQKVQEISWLSDELEREIGVLRTTQHPVVHQFLVVSLANGIARRAAALSQSVLGVERDSSLLVSEEKAS
jgi:hypothetical protein